MIPQLVAEFTGQPLIYAIEDKGDRINLPERPYSGKVIPLKSSLDNMFL